ncbi:FtsX-like permease family protein [Paenibacillus lutimineralis]|uniref:ABC transporter permease n=1 Tax=Paenibacillus lutimineralis TaxID=2707005 RepID=A0A3S9V3D9_9BACL|nr:FtsX-like permease family protein [Paenibacillus lutimineralis]AZS16897.1 ABC transporter permease [Paenibacillus lutimineralis]
MQKKALWKDIFREIWRTKARFLSIFAIIMLGVGFFVGIKATGPDMLDTAEHYYEELNLMDVKVQTTYGLKSVDIDELKKVPDVEAVQPGYSSDVFLDDSGLIANIRSYQPGNIINRYLITQGRLPETSGEIALDKSGKTKHYKLGDTITFTNPDTEVDLNDTFHTLSYKVVGFVQSPQYINTIGRGTSQIGKGTTDVFAVIPEQDFHMSVYTEAYMTFKDSAGLRSYSDEYADRIEAHTKAVEQALTGMPEERLSEVREEGQAKLDEAKQKIADAKQQLADAEKKLSDAKLKLDEGETSYQEGVDKLQSELVKGQGKLDKAARELDQGRAQLAQNKQKISSGQAKLQEARELLNVQKKEIQPKLAGGRELAGSLQQIAAVPPDSIPQSQRDQLVAGSKAADSALGQAVAGYMAGEVDAAALKQAAGAFEQGLNQAEQKLEAAEKGLNSKAKELESGAAQLKAADKKLAQGELDWKQGKEELAKAKQEGEAKLAKAKADLDQGRRDYEEGLRTYREEKQDADAKIADGEHDLTEGHQKLDDLKLPKVYVLDRDSNPGYTEFEDNAERLASIAKAFPVFFFLIAALVSLTTMTRMVEEQRLQIGTLKALGYSNGDIMRKFLVYGTLASVLATGAGLTVGFTLFPTIIYNAYGSLYNLPEVRLNFYLSYSLMSLIVAVLCTTVTAFTAARVELRSGAAVLMRPKAPKSGSRIFLERIPLIWRQLNFTGKVTARNLFRYKQRMFMTVCGVAGCTALILTGFGLKDSIRDIAPLQYGKIMKYNAAIIFKDESNPAGEASYHKLIEDTPGITGTLNVSQEVMQAVRKGVNSQDIHLFIPESTEHFSDFVVLRERGQKQILNLPDDGAIVTEKLAKLFNLHIGSKLVIQNNSNDSFELKVAGISENYTMHYAYMTPRYYESIFGKQPQSNMELINYSNHEPSFEDQFGEQLTGNERVAMVSFTSGVSGSFEDTMDSMNVVVIVLIISAAALAFVVLYNLTNINVSERIRELSTIKVLGFYDQEVTMYIYRENMILTILGIIAGDFLGIVLHRFVLKTAEVDVMMFSPTIHWFSYGYAAALTLLFSGIVMVTMHYKLKHIDMIEALKSVE